MASVSEFMGTLEDMADPDDIGKVARFFKGSDPDTRIMGISIGKIFPVAKRFVALSFDDVEALLDDDRYEVRMAAVAVLDFKARQKTLDDMQRKALFDLYLRRHDRINNWDLVDRAAPHVVGEYLVDRDRSLLHDLAGSEDPNVRRTAIVSTCAFIKRGQVSDTFEIAERLAGDRDTYVQKALASWVREAGKRDQEALVRFLTAFRTILPRSTLTAASKGLPDDIRALLRS